MRILGIDPSIRSTGYGVIEILKQGEIRGLVHGEIKTAAKYSQSECLLRIVNELGEVIAKYVPDECAMEQIIYVQNTRTAIYMGAARAAGMIAAAQAGVPMYEYPAKLIKKAVTGVGSAQKEQVGFMMRALLGLRETPGSDAGDALAVAVTHYQQRQNPAVKRR